MSQSFSPELARQIQNMANALNGQGRVIDDLRSKVNQLVGIEAVLSSVKVSHGTSGFGSDGSGVSAERRNAPMLRDPSGHGYVSLDQIPGRHIPYDFLCKIPILDGQPGNVQETIYVTPEGPFVATARFAVFQSFHSFEVRDAEGQSATFFGRSNGRFRPISSDADIMDAVRAFDQPNQYQPAYIGTATNEAGDIVAVGNPLGVNALSDADSYVHMLPGWPGNGIPITASPFSMSAFRTMSFDGLISVETKGSQFRRQQIPVPSTFWTSPDGGATPLATLDVFEPGELVTVSVQPSHANNPAYGNIQNSGYFNTAAGAWTFDPATGAATGNPFPPGLFPSLASQYDGHEGIDGASRPGDTSTTTDPVSRNATGVLYIGYKGYKIIQPPAIVR